MKFDIVSNLKNRINRFCDQSRHGIEAVNQTVVNASDSPAIEEQKPKVVVFHRKNTPMAKLMNFLKEENKLPVQRILGTLKPQFQVPLCKSLIAYCETHELEEPPFPALAILYREMIISGFVE